MSPGGPRVDETTPAGTAPAVTGSPGRSTGSRPAAGSPTPPRGVPGVPPYLIIIVIFSIVNLGVVRDALAKEPWTVKFGWPGLDILGGNGKPLSSTTFTLNWLPAAGTLMIVADILTVLVLRLSAGRALRAHGRTYVELRSAIVTVMAVLAWRT